MSGDRFNTKQVQALLGYQSEREIDQAVQRGELPAADGEGEAGRYWSKESLDQSAPLGLSAIAELAGVHGATPQKWHRSPTGKAARGYEKKTPHPIKSVADAMGTDVPQFDEIIYPRRVVVAFLKAIGYMDAEGRLVEEIQNKGAGRWSPVKPTIDPRPVTDPEEAVDSRTGKPLALDPVTRGRYRYYAVHAAPKLGYASKPVFDQSLNKGRVPAADGYDELQRPFWWLETLEAHLAGAEERKLQAKAGPKPDGYTDDGKPYRLLPDDGHYAQKGEAGAAEKPEKNVAE
ncbi:hypothetical protein [Streptomyces sp. NBC_01601]|uniref:hypothetical protein n=1 Tax=Streptomyces sp. NBC_01601 TaxID=2975892 RepID=UPI002E28F758|nr:hypothetical protein [Streptomyces sp. NBC_01601]